MIKKKLAGYNLLNIFTDILVIDFAYILSIWVWLGVVDNKSGNISQNLTIIAIYSFFLLFLYQSFNLYNTFRFRTLMVEIYQIIKVNCIGIIILGLTFYILRMEEFSRGVLVSFFLFSTILIIAKRILFRYILRCYQKRGFNQKRVLVVGSGHLAQRYVHNIKKNAQYGLLVEGYVSKNEEDGLGKRLGKYEDLNEILQDTGIDEVVIALEPHEIQFISHVIGVCDKQGTKVYIIPFYNDYFPTAPAIDVIGDLKLMNMRTIPLDNYFAAIQKRSFDIIASFILIIISSPIMLITAIGIKLSGPGSVVFKQERVGRYKKMFIMYKFRSMRINAESSTAWSKNTDNRKTKFGSFIRKTSIDELLQFFNVLKGDMSLVGPRPEIPLFVEQFKESIPLYMLKHQVRPGITGWAQINGYRGDTSIEERIKHDIWYIENWNILLDIKIIFMTAFGGMVNKEKINRA